MKKLPVMAKSPVLSKLLKLLDDGHKLHKHQVAELCDCHHYTAMRYLKELHKACVVRICGWHRCFGGPIPKYELHNGRPDVPKVDRLTAVERQRRRRKKPAAKEYERQYSRARLHEKRALKGRIRIGIWGL